MKVTTLARAIYSTQQRLEDSDAVGIPVNVVLEKRDMVFSSHGRKAVFAVAEINKVTGTQVEEYLHSLVLYLRRVLRA